MALRAASNRGCPGFMDSWGRAEERLSCLSGFPPGGILQDHFDPLLRGPGSLGLDRRAEKRCWTSLALGSSWGLVVFFEDLICEKSVLWVRVGGSWRKPPLQHESINRINLRSNLKHQSNPIINPYSCSNDPEALSRLNSRTPVHNDHPGAFPAPPSGEASRV
ncbi:hypothetical protein KM043_001204 [Ampulex compressa]|nr:hypothetical protein KM043_001204 [Ampulex compressa]